MEESAWNVTINLYFSMVHVIHRSVVLAFILIGINKKSTGIHCKVPVDELCSRKQMYVCILCKVDRACIQSAVEMITTAKKRSQKY